MPQFDDDNPPSVVVYITSVLVLCLALIIFVLLLTVFHHKDAADATENLMLISTVFGICAPIIAALLAVAVQRVHSTLNGRVSQWRQDVERSVETTSNVAHEAARAALLVSEQRIREAENRPSETTKQR